MKIQITPPPSLSYSRILPGTHFVLATSLGTINQYKINRLYCLLLICIKTSILFCVLKYLEAQHALERNTPAHNTSVVQNTPSEIGNTQSVSELQHAKCATLKSCNTPNVLIYNTHFCPLYQHANLGCVF